MIQFDKTKTVEKEVLFFLPQQLKSLVTQVLRQENIPYQSIFWKDVDTKKFARELKEAKIKYNKAGWEDLNDRYGGLISHIHPDEIFCLSQQFFGPAMDLDYKKMQKEAEEKALAEYEKYHAKYDD